MNRFARHLLPILFVYLVSVPSLLHAQDFFEIVDIEETEQEKNTDKNWRFRGHVQQEMKYGTQTPDENLAFDRQDKGISQVRTELFAEYKTRFTDSLSAQISAKTEIDWLRHENGEETWELHEYQTLIKDAYIDYTFETGLWARLGNQVIAWGESESLSITDVLSTQDFREPGQAELEDIREPIPALLLSQPLDIGENQTNLNLVVSYKAGTDRYAKSYEDFYPLIAFKNSGAAPGLGKIETEADWEAALQYKVLGNGGDYSVVVAEINNNTSDAYNLQMGTTGIDNAAFLQKRQQFYGMSANKVIDSVLLRGELGVLEDIALPAQGNAPLTLNKEKRLMFGLEYNGWSDWLFALEYNYLDRSPLDAAAEDEQSSGYVLRSQYSALNDKLTSQFWYLKLAEEGGEISRVSVDYKPIDNWEFSAAYVAYMNDKPDSTLYPFRYNDTINLALKYGF